MLNELPSFKDFQEQLKSNGFGLKKGLLGRFGMYIPPLMEALGLVELTHDAKGNKMRAK